MSGLANIANDTKALKILAALSTIKGSRIASIDTKTDEVLLGGKKNPMQGRIQKVSTGCRVQFFTNTTLNAYENTVRRRLEAEGKNPDDFQLSGRKWGQRIPNTPFVENGDTIYIEVQFLGHPEVSYLLDGEPIAKEDIQGLKPSTSEAAQGGLSDENKVILRTYKLKSITKLKMGENSVF